MSSEPEGQEIVSNFRKVASITVFFVVVGPPIGSIVWFSLGSLVSVVSKASLNFDAAKEMLLGIFVGLFGMPFGYVYGFVPAAVAGVAIGVLQIIYGRLHWAIVLAIGALVGIGDFFAWEAIFDPLFSQREAGKLFLPVPTCMVATFLCWEFVKNWYPRRIQPEKNCS